MNAVASTSFAGSFNKLAEELLHVVSATESCLRTIDPAEAAAPLAPGKWSRKQIIGHLLDSACNNHLRFVRASIEGQFTGPHYDQDACIRIANPQAASWKLLIDFWSSYNQYLAHILTQIPEECAAHKCSIGDNPEQTLYEVAESYFLHMAHHLVQIGTLSAGKYSPFVY